MNHLENKYTKKMSIVLLDFASEKNRGDAAMQMSIILLTKKYFPTAALSVITVFGVNQHPDCLEEFDHTYPLHKGDVSYVGGIMSTYESINASDTKNLTYHQSSPGRILRLMLMFCITVFVKVGLPDVLVRKCMSNEGWKTFQIIRNADFILWNGRNFRGYSVVKEPFAIYSLCIHPLLCIVLGKPMVCLGASVWRLKNPISRYILRYTLSRCILVTLRESASFSYVHSLAPDLVKRDILRQVPDLSLPVLQQMPHIVKPINKQPVIVMTIVGQREIGNQNIYHSYISAMHNLAQYICSELKGTIVIMPQVVYKTEPNAKAIEEIFTGIERSRYTVITEEYSVQQLVEAYRKADFLIATRMHSAIFALTAGTAVLAITYDSGAKWDILKNMGLPEWLVLPVSDIQQIDVVKKFEKGFNERNALMLIVKEKLATKVYSTATEQFILAKTRLMYPYDE